MGERNLLSASTTNPSRRPGWHLQVVCSRRSLHPPSTPLESHRINCIHMLNTFIIIRFVFFAMLIYLNLVSLIFASWHAHITSSMQKKTSGAVVFVMFNSTATLLLVAGGLLELAWQKARTAAVKVECCWAAVSTIFQIAATVNATVNIFGMSCRTGDEWGVCASANLVVLSTWIGSFTMLAYFLVLFITSVLHMHDVPQIWSSSIFAVEWFPSRPCDHVSVTKLESEPSVYGDNEGGFRDSWGRHWPFKRRDRDADRDSDRQSQQSRFSTRPKWSRALTIKRGVDEPFARKGSRNNTIASKHHHAARASHSPTGSNLLLPPDAVCSKESVTGRSEGSRYVELFRESILPPIPTTELDTDLYYGLPSSSTSGVANPFPLKLADNDKPIPLPRLSKWIRADEEKGINVHTIPALSP